MRLVDPLESDDERRRSEGQLFLLRGVPNGAEARSHRLVEAALDLFFIPHEVLEVLDPVLVVYIDFFLFGCVCV